MASSASPVTPASQIVPPATESPPTGTWRHPRFDEIARRQHASTFTDRNVSKILWNAGSLVGTWIVGQMFQTSDLLVPIYTYSAYPLLLLRILLLFNILAAAFPLFRRKDELADIPLTPSQRALLGLDPNATPPTTPGGHYITPPRYRRSSTPRTSTPGSRSSSYAGSPLSSSASPLPGKAQGGSPFSPTASPLWQKAVGGGSREVMRRNSYGSPSPFGAGTGNHNASMMGVPSTPSPTNGKGASVPLNSRWLYEKGRGSPGSPRLYS